MKSLTIQSRTRRPADGRVHVACGIIPGAKSVDDPVAMGSMAHGLDDVMSQPMFGYIFVGAPNLATLLKVVAEAHKAAVLAGEGEYTALSVPEFRSEDFVSIMVALRYFDQLADLDGHATRSTGSAEWISSETLRYFIIHAPSSSELMPWATHLYKNIERLGSVVTTRSSGCSVSSGGAAMPISFGDKPVYGLTRARIEELARQLNGVPAK